jgi:hypothetical protein
MEDYNYIYYVGNFEATTLVYLTTRIPDQIYYVSSVLSISYIEFEIYPRGYVRKGNYSLWLTADPGKLINPLDFKILEPFRTDYFRFDP